MLLWLKYSRLERKKSSIFQCISQYIATACAIIYLNFKFINNFQANQLWTFSFDPKTSAFLQMSDNKTKSCASATSKKTSNGKFRISFNQDYTYVVTVTNLNRYIYIYRRKNGSVISNDEQFFKTKKLFHHY